MLFQTGEMVPWYVNHVENSRTRPPAVDRLASLQIGRYRPALRPAGLIAPARRRSPAGTHPTGAPTSASIYGATPGAVLAGVEPARFPLGRWPAKTEHPLVCSQQFSVNDILERLGEDGGVYAVNGPPGTGKTTQLRDLIAAVFASSTRGWTR